MGKTGFMAGRRGANRVVRVTPAVTEGRRRPGGGHD